MPHRTSRWSLLTAVATAARSALRPGSPGLAARLAAVPRLVRATLRGEYAGSTRTHLAMLVAAGLYVLSPVDLVPEALFSVFGLADDAVVVSFIVAALVNDTEAFLHWERTRGPQDSPSWSPQEPVRSHVVS